MIKPTAALLGPLLAFASPAVAAGPFDGTWKADLTTAQFPKKPDVLLLSKGVYTCSTCVPVFTVAADGASHALSGFPYFDEAAITVVDALSVSEVDKLKGKVVSTSTTSVTPDGQTLTVAWNDLSAPDGKPVTGQFVQDRVGPRPAGAHAISGTWRTKAYANLSDSAVTMTITTAGDRISTRSPNGYGYDAVAGGPPVPYIGDTSNMMVTIAQPDPMTLIETDLRNGKAIGRYTMKALPGGRTIQVFAENLEKDRSGSYTLVKQ